MKNFFDDAILEQLLTVFEGKVGPAFSEEELSEMKKEAIQLYTQICKDFDLPFNKKIYKKSTSEIWDKAIRLVDLQIKERNH